MFSQSGALTPGGAFPLGISAMGMKTPVEACTHDEELDALFPPGYKILPPPTGYMPLRTPTRKLAATATALGSIGGSGFHARNTRERWDWWQRQENGAKLLLT
ncbi:splicing factor 3B subunit 1 [Ancylostoma caninum]|uniref:Splicing factor 3B subunit 1 n=1 Tax=Ancylostoma caninum TaxID=29170 RepID=A0A368GCZ8_ANCCA|nr:splicing factor 3B subunit 1 [Ancylostoma caninum]